MTVRTKRNCIIVEAVRLDVIHELAEGERMHPLCTDSYRCNDCTLGVDASVFDINWCPLCGAAYMPYGSPTYYNGAINKRYKCGTIVNMCSHYERHSDSITSISIGDECRGMNDDDII